MRPAAFGADTTHVSKRGNWSTNIHNPGVAGVVDRKDLVPCKHRRWIVILRSERRVSQIGDRTGAFGGHLEHGSGIIAHGREAKDRAAAGYKDPRIKPILSNIGAKRP